MTDKEIQDLPIEEIIKLPELSSITKRGGYEYGADFGFGYIGYMNPFWEIRFNATRHPDGHYLWGDLKIPHPTYLIYKMIK